MRIYFSSMAHPKRLSKRFQKEANIPLNRAQAACAVMFGYRDWHELEQVTAVKQYPPSKPDWLVSTEIAETRRHAFSHRLFNALSVDGDEFFEHDEILELLNRLTPTGSIPDDPAFFDARLSSLFKTQWHWTAAHDDDDDLDDQPPYGFTASVGQVGSRTFESMVVDVLKKQRISSVQSGVYMPRDEVGFRTFAFSFPDRERFSDIKSHMNDVALIPFRFIPTIVDDVMLELELQVHPGALASSFIDDDDAGCIARAICAYLDDSAIWVNSDACVTGAANGLHLTLSGGVTSPSVSRILDALLAELAVHCEAYDPDDLIYDGNIFLPIRELTDDLEDEVSEEAARSDFLAVHGDEFVRHLFRETVAMSRAPAILKHLLVTNGFSQYAEFCDGLDVASSLDDKRKFVKFVCSMEKARAIAPHHSLFFRYDILERVVGAMESECDNPEIDDYGNIELSAKAIAQYAVAARTLGDEEMARMVEQNGGKLWEIARAGHNELIGLIMSFAPEEDELGASECGQRGGEA